MSENALAFISVLGTISSIALPILRSAGADAATIPGRESTAGRSSPRSAISKTGIDDIRKKQEQEDQRHLEVVSRLVAVESSAKQAHRRLDAIEGQCERRD